MKKFLLKSLLVAVGLLTGGSAWGQISTWSYNSTLANNTIGSAFSGSTSGVVSVTLGTEEQAENWDVTSLNSKSRGLANKVSAYSFDPVNTNVPTNGTFMVVTPIKDIKFEVNSYASDNVWVYLTDGSNNTRTQLSRSKNNITSTATKLLKDKTYYIVGYNTSSTVLDRSFSFTGFTATTYESYTIHYQDGSGNTIKDDVVYQGLFGSSVTASEGDMAGIEYNDKYYVYDSGNESIELGTGTNEITLEYEQATPATITVKYWNDAEPAVEIKDATSIESYEGATDVSASGDKLPTYIWYNDVKYKYDSGNTPIAMVTGDATINLTYTEEDKYTYSVTDNFGNTLASGSAYKGDDVDFYVPYYAFEDGRFYQSPSLSSGSLSYGKSTISSISANTEITVTYTEEENTNVVFYSEAETLTSVTPHEDGYTQVRMSNGKVGYYSSQTAFASLPAGKYTIMASTRAGTTRFYAGNVGEGIEIMSLTSSGAVTNKTSDPFVLTETTNIYTSTGDESNYFDYVIIRKTGEVAKIGATGWTTFASPYALDLSNMEATTGTVTAYYASAVGDDKVTMTSTDQAAVQAGEGIMLKGTADAIITIPVVASGTAISGNKLVGCTTKTELDVNTSYYVLVNNSGTAEFQRLGTNGATIPAGKAYLNAGTSDVRSLKIAFEDAETGINEVNAPEATANGYYNLSGQRVANPTKGLYIVNGKKVIVK